MSDVRTKANGLNSSFPVPGVNNSSQGFRDNTTATQQALFQASDEITRLQNTKILATGDALGSSITFQAASNPTNPDVVLNLTLRDVFSGQASLDTRSQDFTLTLDNQGRVRSAQVVTRTTNFTANTALGPVGNLGTGTGSINWPLLTFDAMGRLTQATQQTITYGLTGHTMAKGSVLVGDAASKSQVFASPSDNASYALVATNGTLNWQVISNGTVTGIISGPGIHVTSNPQAPVIKLDLASLTANQTPTALDQVAWLASDGSNYRMTIDSLRKVAGRVILDTAPSLGGNLDVLDKKIQSSQASGVVIASAPTSPKATIQVNEQGVTLQAGSGALLTLSGLQWPTTTPTLGQVLSLGTGTQLVWSSQQATQINLPNTVFVSTSGNDANGQGSLTNPYASIAKALSVLTPAVDAVQTIMLLGGVWTENVTSGDSDRRIWNLAIENFYSTRPSTIVGSVTMGPVARSLRMRAVTINISGRDPTDLQPALSIQSGLDMALIDSCQIFRGDSSLPAINFSGPLGAQDIVVQNTTITGLVQNYLACQGGGRLVIQNTGSQSDWQLEQEALASTLLRDIPVIKSIYHKGGRLEAQGVESWGQAVYQYSDPQTQVVTPYTAGLFSTAGVGGDVPNYFGIMNSQMILGNQWAGITKLGDCPWSMDLTRARTYGNLIRGPRTLVREQQSGTQEYLGETRVLEAGDLGTSLRLTNNTPVKLVVDLQSNSGLPVGTKLDVIQGGAGQVEIQGVPGVIIRTPVGRYTRRRFSRVVLEQWAPNVWDLQGDLDTSRPMITVDDVSTTWKADRTGTTTDGTTTSDNSILTMDNQSININNS